MHQILFENTGWLVPDCGETIHFLIALDHRSGCAVKSKYHLDSLYWVAQSTPILKNMFLSVSGQKNGRYRH